MTAASAVRTAGCSFALIFTAYNTAQNFLTTLIGPAFGSANLALVYAGLIVATPLAPALVPRLGVRRGLMIGGCGYVAFMLALLVYALGPGWASACLLSASSWVNGMCGALLWSAQGSLVISAPGAARSELVPQQAGVFWSVFQLSAVFGNLLALVGFSQGGSAATLFAVFAGLAAAGVVLLATLPAAPSAGLAAADSADGASGGDASTTAGAATTTAATAAATSCASTAAREARAMGGFVVRARRLAPLLVLGGALMAYQFGTFPLHLERTAVGLTFTLFGLAEVAGGVALGRLCGALGRRRFRPLVLALTALSLAAAAPLELGAARAGGPIRLDQPGRLALPIAAALLFGLSDSAIVVLAYAALADACGGAGAGAGAGVADSARAGGCRQLLYSVGFLLGFALGPYVTGAWQLAALGALLLGAAACTRDGVVVVQQTSDSSRS